MLDPEVGWNLPIVPSCPSVVELEGRRVSSPLAEVSDPKSHIKVFNPNHQKTGGHSHSLFKQGTADKTQQFKLFQTPQTQPSNRPAHSEARTLQGAEMKPKCQSQPRFSSVCVTHHCRHTTAGSSPSRRKGRTPRPCTSPCPRTPCRPERSLEGDTRCCSLQMEVSRVEDCVRAKGRAPKCAEERRKMMEIQTYPRKTPIVCSWLSAAGCLPAALGGSRSSGDFQQLEHCGTGNQAVGGDPGAPFSKVHTLTWLCLQERLWGGSKQVGKWSRVAVIPPFLRQN